jgi:hypothetical protein
LLLRRLAFLAIVDVDQKVGKGQIQLECCVEWEARIVGPSRAFPWIVIISIGHQKRRPRDGTCSSFRH